MYTCLCLLVIKQEEEGTQASLHHLQAQMEANDEATQGSAALLEDSSQQKASLQTHLGAALLKMQDIEYEVLESQDTVATGSVQNTIPHPLPAASFVGTGRTAVVVTSMMTSETSGEATRASDKGGSGSQILQQVSDSDLKIVQNELTTLYKYLAVASDESDTQLSNIKYLTEEVVALKLCLARHDIALLSSSEAAVPTVEQESESHAAAEQLGLAPTTIFTGKRPTSGPERPNQTKSELMLQISEMQANINFLEVQVTAQSASLAEAHADPVTDPASGPVTDLQAQVASLTAQLAAQNNTAEAAYTRMGKVHKGEMQAFESTFESQLDAQRVAIAQTHGVENALLEAQIAALILALAAQTTAADIAAAQIAAAQSSAAQIAAAQSATAAQGHQDEHTAQVLELQGQIVALTAQAAAQSTAADNACIAFTDAMLVNKQSMTLALELVSGETPDFQPEDFTSLFTQAVAAREQAAAQRRLVTAQQVEDSRQEFERVQQSLATCMASLDQANERADAAAARETHAAIRLADANIILDAAQDTIAAAHDTLAAMQVMQKTLTATQKNLVMSRHSQKESEERTTAAEALKIALVLQLVSLEDTAEDANYELRICKRQFAADRDVWAAESARIQLALKESDTATVQLAQEEGNGAVTQLAMAQDDSARIDISQADDGRLVAEAESAVAALGIEHKVICKQEAGLSLPPIVTQTSFPGSESEVNSGGSRSSGSGFSFYSFFMGGSSSGSRSDSNGGSSGSSSGGGSSTSNSGAGSSGDSPLSTVSERFQGLSWML